MPQITRRQVLATGTAFLAAGPLAAQDGGLYRKTDPDASFLRVVAPAPLPARIGGTAAPMTEDGIGAYVEVQPGRIATRAGALDLAHDIPPARFFTLALDGSGAARLVEDTPAFDPAQADLSFYNLTDRAGLSLFVPAARAAAFENVGAGEARDVAIRAPLSLAFEVRAGDEVLARIDEVVLRRKLGTTIVFSEGAAGYRAVAGATDYLR